MFTALFFRRLFFGLSGLFCVAALLHWPELPLRIFHLALGGLFLVAGRRVRQGFGHLATGPLVPVPRLSDLAKGYRVVVLGALALGLFFVLPKMLRLFDPTAGGFAPDTVNAVALGALEYFAALSLAYAGWRWLFPSLYEYAAETMEGKLLESITGDLFARLEHTDPRNVNYTESLAQFAERRKIATFQFLIRCIRFVFSVSPFVFFFVEATHALSSALTAVPGSAPAL